MDSPPEVSIKPETEKTNSSKTKCTLKDRILHLKTIVTVEPLIACWQMAQFLSKPALDNLEFEKSCRVNLNYSDDICNDILSGNHRNHTHENDAIQIMISNMHSWQKPVQSFMPLILALFLGSFSDRHKWRKPFLFLPVIGELIGSLGCILCVVFMHSWPLEILGVFQKVVPSFFGGQTMLVMASTAYIADVSSLKMRTLRLGIVQLVIGATLPLVQSFSGILFVEIGYMRIFGLTAVLNVVALSYGMFWIKEPRVRLKSEKKCILLDVFNPKHARDTFSLLIKENQHRSGIYFVIGIIFFQRFAFDGETDVLYLYTQNKFQWTPLEFSYFVTSSALIHLVGNAIGISFFTKVLRLSDLTIMLVTVLNKVVTNVIFGLANSVTLLYIGVASSIFTRMFRIVKKSIATKVVSENDIGKAQSLFGICEALAPAVSVPIYNKLIYLNTLHGFSATFFFFSIIFYGICCFLIIFMYVKTKGAKNGEKTIRHTEETIQTNETALYL